MINKTNKCFALINKRNEKRIEFGTEDLMRDWIRRDKEEGRHTELRMATITVTTVIEVLPE